MAFTIDQLVNDGTIEVIVSKDTALLDLDKDTYTEYLKTLDEKLLKFKDGEAPCRFVMKKRVDYKKQKWLDNQMVVYSEGEAQYQAAFALDVVRACLDEIKYPDYVPMEKRIIVKKTGDGYVDDRTMSMLAPTGICHELFVARSMFIDKESGGASLKK
jgi:aconitase B